MKLKVQSNLSQAERKKVIRLISAIIQVRDCHDVINADYIRILPIEYRSEIKMIVEKANMVKHLFLRDKDESVESFLDILSETRIQILEQIELINQKEEATALALLRDFNNSKVKVATVYEEKLVDLANSIPDAQKEAFFKKFEGLVKRTLK